MSSKITSFLTNCPKSFIDNLFQQRWSQENIVASKIPPSTSEKPSPASFAKPKTDSSAASLVFLSGFLFLFFLSPILYSYVSISQTDKRTDYPGKEIASKVQLIWSKDFNEEIQFVTGDEWKAGNLSYHLKSRPVWEGSTNSEILKNASQFICVEDVCLGRY